MILRLDHRARHEAADGNGVAGIADRPDHGAADAVRHGDDGVVGDIKPLAVEPYPVMTTGAFTIDIGDGRAISIGATRPAAAREVVEPGLDLGIGAGEASIVACDGHADAKQRYRDQDNLSHGEVSPSWRLPPRDERLIGAACARGIPALLAMHLLCQISANQSRASNDGSSLGRGIADQYEAVITAC